MLGDGRGSGLCAPAHPVVPMVGILCSRVMALPARARASRFVAVGVATRTADRRIKRRASLSPSRDVLTSWR